MLFCTHYQEHFSPCAHIHTCAKEKMLSADKTGIKAKAVLGTYPFQNFLSKSPLLNLILLFYKTHPNFHAILAKIKAKK